MKRMPKHNKYKNTDLKFDMLVPQTNKSYTLIKSIEVIEYYVISKPFIFNEIHKFTLNL